MGTTSIDLVLIDDDELIHMAWQYVAKLRKHTILTFNNPEQFFHSNVAKEVPIYIDYFLGEEGASEKTVRDLVSRGYSQVFLCTGMPLESLDLPAGIQGVVGKDYPLSKR